MAEVERSAASVEEAIEAALAELGISEQEAAIEIVQDADPEAGGTNARMAIVRVRALSTVEVTEGDGDGEPDEQADAAADFLEGLVRAMGIDGDVEINVVGGTTYLDIWGGENSDEVAILIGKRGHTLDSLQDLVRGFVQRQGEERCRVQVDVEDYRKRQRSRILRRAREVAMRVSKTGRPEALDPMNPYERKLVHDTVGEFKGLESASEGQDPERRVVIRKRS